ncbi:MAG: hypothetical protein NTZ38_02450 [Candidatus Taylorbacteria bacterium]|nr:hypothetical protein [Candidatus Taylorbacteria bacterium]
MASSNNQKINKVKINEAILRSDIDTLTIKTLRDIINIRKNTTLFPVINRLIKDGILKRLESNKYIIPSKNPSRFLIANFLHEPSYISFESALNFHGILSQFPSEITSATIRKTRNKEIDSILYSYSHIAEDLFWGYEKRNGFLIAFPEKALLDQIYLSTNGKKQIDIHEYDLSNINKGRFQEYLNNIKLGKTKDKISEIVKTNKIL